MPSTVALGFPCLRTSHEYVLNVIRMREVALIVDFLKTRPVKAETKGYSFVATPHTVLVCLQRPH